MQREIEDLHATLDQETKAKGDTDKQLKQMELQVCGGCFHLK